MIAVHNHPGYSNCPKCVERIMDLEQSIDVHLTEKLVLIRGIEERERRIAQLEDDVRVLRLKVGVRAQMVDALASRGQREG